MPTSAASRTRPASASWCLVVMACSLTQRSQCQDPNHVQADVRMGAPCMHFHARAVPAQPALARAPAADAGRIHFRPVDWVPFALSWRLHVTIKGRIASASSCPAACLHAFCAGHAPTSPLCWAFSLAFSASCFFFSSSASRFWMYARSSPAAPPLSRACSVNTCANRARAPGTWCRLHRALRRSSDAARLSRAGGATQLHH